MEIVRLSTAGSVDDGKSTFIGRLLYDTKSLPKDKIENIETVSRKRGLAEIDLSLITDGLTAEREQGITIDVAHIYFKTDTRKYIIADTPGHVEYTRNMITGASNSKVFMILIDARKGILEQTKRHLYIATLMQIKEIVFVINKMDLVAYKASVYEQILNDLEQLQAEFNLNNRNLSYFPISAKFGDNVVTPSKNMDWYQEETVLQYLEKIKFTDDEIKPFRFNVQYVIRPHSNEFHDFRGYSGTISSGKLNVGDTIQVQSSKQIAKVKAIHRYKESLENAQAGDAVVIELEKDIDISRGDLLTIANNGIEGTKQLNSKLCWLHTAPLNLNQKYLLKQGGFSTQVKVSTVKTQFEFEKQTFQPFQGTVNVNSINEVELKSAAPIFLDSFDENQENGSFILVDPLSNSTVAVGFNS